jgi:hypothetical protein
VVAGGLFSIHTVVQAPSSGAADGACEDLGFAGSTLGTLNSLGYTAAPSDYWLCIPGS